MIDIDTLLDRLRRAAADHGSAQHPEEVDVHRWPPVHQAGTRHALIDALTLAQPSGLGHFLVMDREDFVELAFRTCLGCAAEPAGRAHYLRGLQEGVPRLETLAQLAASPEAISYRGPPHWPLWFLPILWGLRRPFPGTRRAARGALRRIEGWLGKRAGPTAQGLIWSLAAATDEQDRFHQREMTLLSGDLASLSRDLTSATERLAQAENRLSSDLTSATERLAQAENGLSGLADFEASSKASSQALAQALAAIRARMALLDYGAGSPKGPRTATPVAAARPAADEDLTGYYLTLESVFRGDSARIRAQLEADYLTLLLDARDRAGDGPCVDLGCGRGEWLDVLGAYGFKAQGVDLNPAMATAAKARGHDVTVNDALAYLRALPDDGALVISGFHIAEHLDFPTLFRVIAESRRALKPQGLLILETPNPENIWVATHTFHHDPTHDHPLTPSSLEFLVNHHGLETVAVLRLHPYPQEARLPGNDPVSERLNGMTCCGQDFAVVAKKTPLA